MGSPDSEPGRSILEGPQHEVTLTSFYIGVYHVKQMEYEKLMGTNPSFFKGYNHPVENVNWFDAIEYCNKRSRKEGLILAYTRENNDIIWNRNANGYRLPTEAEWEYACRAGTVTSYNTGKNITKNLANFNAIIGKTVPAGSYAPNVWGLYDMHGNVWDWCWDLHGNYHNQKETDPAGSSSGMHRVLRGGSWCSSISNIRSAYRYVDHTSSFKYNNTGFRIARNVE